METIEKPWGQEEILETNESYTVKRLTINAGCKCSLQYHRDKKETIFVLEGPLKIYIENEEGSLKSKIYNYGDVVTINPFITHRMEGTNCIGVYLECSTPQLDDVVRIEDDYGRK